MPPDAPKDAPGTIIYPDPALPLAEQPGLVLAALTMIGEARGEPTVGKKAVLWVIRNRRRIAREFVEKRGRAHPLFGDGSLASCVLKKYQFSCWMGGADPNLAYLWDLIHDKGGKLWPVYYALAALVESETELDDPTHGATHYCTTALWNKPDVLAWYGEPEIDAGRTQETVTIKNHIFAKVR